jgi:hypothetical protein
MATPRRREDTPSAERSITRTYRAAVRLGEDYITIEETITLPTDATDEDIQRAVETGLRIFEAQRAAIEAQTAATRAAAGAVPGGAVLIRDPDAPASEKQRNYIAALQEDLAWSNDQLNTYAADHQVDLLTLTKGQASTFIDGLKHVAEDRAGYDAQPRQRAVASNGEADSAPANTRQHHALDQLAQRHNLVLADETRRRYAVAPDQLSYGQATALIRELQRNGRVD